MRKRIDVPTNTQYLLRIPACSLSDRNESLLSEDDFVCRHVFIVLLVETLYDFP